MGFESLSMASRNRLVEIASQAYGSGKNEGVNGGAGRIGILTGSDGRTHVVKFNTKLSERLFGPAKTDYMIDSCNRLRAELMALAREAGLDEKEMAMIRAKLGLDHGSDQPKSLLDRTVVAQVATMIGKSEAQKKGVWDFARPKAEKSMEDMSFETVASRQAFGTKAATAEKVNELEKFGLTYDSLKKAVETLAVNKGLSPNGKAILFSQMADHVFTSLCGKSGDRAAREAEVRECLESIADGTHPLIRRHLDESAMIEYLQGRVESAMREESVTADALFALYKEASALIASHCEVRGVKLGNPDNMSDDPFGRTIAALLNGSEKLMKLCDPKERGGAHAEVCGRTTMKDDRELIRINSFCNKINLVRERLVDENRVRKIGLTMEQFSAVFNEVQISPKYRNRVWDLCMGLIDDHGASIKIDIDRKGIGSWKVAIENMVKMVKAEERRKEGPRLDWEKEIGRFGGVFAKSDESRRNGIALMKKFHGWFESFVKPKGGLSEAGLKVDMEDGFRFFMFRELAQRDAVSDDPKAMFEENALTKLARKGLIGCGSAPIVFLVMPPEDRQVLYAAAAVLTKPVTKMDRVTFLYGRIVHHLDELRELMRTGKLNAQTLFATIIPDSEEKIKGSPTTSDFEKAFQSLENKLATKYIVGDDVYLNYADLTQYTKARNLLDEGKSLWEIEDAMKGLPTGLEKYPVQLSSSLSTFGEDINPGKNILSSDICRPVSADGKNKPAYTFSFPNGTEIVSVQNLHATDEEKSSMAGRVAEQVAKLCGSEHLAQISIIEAEMCQAGFAGSIGKQLQAQGYNTNEHIGLKFTLSRDGQTGAVKIHYAEPEGCKLKISADSTIYADGRIERSELTVEELKS